MISISVPNEPRAIAAAAEFFKILSGETVKIDAEEAPTPATDLKLYTPPAEALEGEPPASAIFQDVPPPPADVLGDPEEEGPVNTGSDDAPPPPATGNLDSSGLPWDARIHSSSRAINADGTWRNRRNLDKAVLATITAELRQAMGAPVVPPPPPAVDAAPVIPPPPPATVDAAPAMKFSELLKRATAAGITKDQATAAAVKLGLPSFAIAATRPDLVPAIAAELGV